MNRLLLLFIGVAFSLGMRAQEHYTRTDSIFVTRVLTEARSLPPSTNVPLHFARLFIGRPYVGHTLEVCDPERLVVNTRQLDCTTLVENVTALTLCTYRKCFTWNDFIKTLTQMRYRNGRLNGYTSRLHYFTDWIADNTKKKLVSECQQPVPPFTATQTINVNYMSTHPDAYKALKEHPQMVSLIKAQEDALQGLRFRYIPKSAVKNTKDMRSAVRDGDIIAITCNKAGLDIAHLGFAVWRSDGLHLLNASQLHKKVVEEPMVLGEYLSKHPSHTGIRIIRINDK